MDLDVSYPSVAFWFQTRHVPITRVWFVSSDVWLIVLLPVSCVCSTLQYGAVFLRLDLGLHIADVVPADIVCGSRNVLYGRDIDCISHHFKCCC